MNMGIHSAYIHFPFCVRKCPYCDFVSYTGCLDKKDEYIKALCREIILTGKEYFRERVQYSDCSVQPGQTVQPVQPDHQPDHQPGLSTVYMGGGTPSLFTPEQIAVVLRQLEETFGIEENAEITLELNPGTVDEAAFRGYREIGINRVSIGIQSFSPRLLSALGRIHSAEQAVHAISWAKAAGFTNISCDLMTGLAGQSLQDAQDSLTVLLENKIPHISFYALTLEEGTPFFDTYLDHEELLPSPELERRMYHTMISRLREEGYFHYEISNCAKPGFESRHNMTYWRALPYFGFGCGASSYRAGKRISNTADLSAYIEKINSTEADLSAITADTEEIDEAESRKEFMLLGLRMMSGVSSDEFRMRYKISMEEVFGEKLQRLTAKGLLIHQTGRYFLSGRGLDYANEVFREFVGS